MHCYSFPSKISAVDCLKNLIKKEQRGFYKKKKVQDAKAESILKIQNISLL